MRCFYLLEQNNQEKPTVMSSYRYNDIRHGCNKQELLWSLQTSMDHISVVEQGFNECVALRQVVLLYQLVLEMVKPTRRCGERKAILMLVFRKPAEETADPTCKVNV